MAFYITTPIYYVNAEPHLGHAYTTIAADVIARHMRQRGEEVFFLTGTDEHGEPVAQAAERQGMTPQELVDQNAPKFKDLVAQMNATNDFFVRTSDEEHKKAVQEVLQAVYDAGHVYAGHYEGYYCPRCADFKTEAELIEGNKCPIHLIELEREVEDNWFFKLSAFQEPLERWYSEHPEWVLPDFRFNEAHSFIKQGLQDISLSRVRISWGVTVPWEPSQVFYVWFDALLNYYTALTYAPGGSVEKFWPPQVQLLAKDILKFHAVIWPALLMAAELPLPERLFIHGYLLMDEHKMSKSLGNVIDPFEVIDKFGTDALRYYLMREVSFGQDGNVSPEGFETRYTTELANEYGNLASRTLTMVANYRDGVIKKVGDAGAGQLADEVCGLFDQVQITGALDAIWQQIRALNGYVTSTEPWKMAKDPERAAELDEVLYRLCDGIRVVSVLLHPWMPDATDTLLDALGEERRTLDAARDQDWAGATVRKIDPLFPDLMVDTHCHLDMCEGGALERAREAGVSRLVTIGMDEESIGKALALAAEEDVFVIAGRHPNSSSGWRAEDLEPIREAAGQPRVVGIGETGLDYYRDYAPQADQRAAFEAQLGLAEELGLPVAIHTRQAEADTFDVLRGFGGTVILHCFSSPRRLDEAVQRGYLCSFAGNVTYPKSTDLQAAAREVPEELLLVETDAPFLSPQPRRGKPNEPGNVTLTARFVAEQRGMTYEELDELVERNAARVFGW